MIDKDTLRQKISKTKESRFNSSKRLMNHQRFSQWAMSVISASLIVLPFIQVSQDQKNLFDIVQSLVAVFLLIYSLIIPAENFTNRSAQMHRCARELDKLLTDLDNDKNIVDISEKYNLILDNYDNHETIDYLPVKYAEKIKYHKKSKSKFKYIPATYYSILSNLVNIRIFIGYIYYIPLIAAFLLLALRFLLPSLK